MAKQGCPRHRASLLGPPHCAWRGPSADAFCGPACSSRQAVVKTLCWWCSRPPGSFPCRTGAASEHRTHSPFFCPRRVNPYGEHYYDGISLNPFEVLFVKTKGVLLGNDWSYSTLATKYDQWMAAQVCSLQQTAHSALRLHFGAVHRLGKGAGRPAGLSSGCLLCWLYRLACAQV